MKPIQLNGRKMAISKETYLDNGATAITIYCFGKTFGIEPYMDLTINMEGVSEMLEENEILIKTWSENEPFLAEILSSVFFEDTGKRVERKMAFDTIQAHIWRMIKEIDGDEVLDIEEYVNDESNLNKINTILYGVEEVEEGLRCRFIQCGYETEKGFTGIISDYEGGGIFTKEYFKNGERLYDRLGDYDDYDVFTECVVDAEEIESYFTDCFVETPDSGEQYIDEFLFEDEFELVEGGNIYVHKNNKPMNPRSSTSGLTKFKK